MTRTRAEAHFVVSNYNEDPARVLAYATSFTLFDQSDDPGVIDHIRSTYPEARFVENPGHSLRNFLIWVWEEYDDLPETIGLIKSNALGRHMSEEYFARVATNQHYTFLYEDPTYIWTPGTSSLLFESAFLEKNNSWYADARPHRYFATYDQLLDFLYVDPIHPEWVLFSPGACYLVPRANVTKNPRNVYRLLAQISAYAYFPAEAYMVERVLHTIFASNAPFNSWVEDWDASVTCLSELPNRSRERLASERLSDRIARRLGWARLPHGRAP